MNRQEKRNIQRDIYKKEKVINKLTPEHVKLIDALSTQKAKKISDDRIEDSTEP
jgi:hypothetical protein